MAPLITAWKAVPSYSNYSLMFTIVECVYMVRGEAQWFNSLTRIQGALLLRYATAHSLLSFCAWIWGCLSTTRRHMDLNSTTYVVPLSAGRPSFLHWDVVIVVVYGNLQLISSDMDPSSVCSRLAWRMKPGAAGFSCIRGLEMFPLAALPANCAVSRLIATLWRVTVEETCPGHVEREGLLYCCSSVSVCDVHEGCLSCLALRRHCD